MLKANNEQIFKIKTKVCKYCLDLAVSTCSGALVESFLEEDHSTEVLKDSRGGEKEFTKSTPVGFNILNIDAG
jgi:hypothetical protein